MRVYILRHAEAIDAIDSMPDEWRYLSGKGCKAAEAVGRRMQKLAGPGLLIVSSPFVRAVQTAQIVAQRVGRKCRVEISGLLRSGNDASDVAEYLRKPDLAENILLVGHEPLLGELAVVLLKSEMPIQLKKAGCIEMEINTSKPDKPARFVSSMIPGKKRIKSIKKAFRS